MRIFKLLPFLLFPLAMAAQQPAFNNDTILYTKILIVPYHPMMHLSDADDDIAGFSNKNKRQIRDQFRYGLLQNADVRLMNSYQTRVLYTNVSGDELQDLETIYGSVDYSMDTVFPVLHPEKDASRPWKKIFGKKNDSPDPQYMNVRMSRPELLGMLSGKYGADLFLFFNQIEIKTHYDDCLDLAMKIYRRDIKVHYSLYDASGRQVGGDVATVHFPSNSNDITEIIRKNFPAVSEYVYKRIPPKEIVERKTASN